MSPDTGEFWNVMRWSFALSTSCVKWRIRLGDLWGLTFNLLPSLPNRIVSPNPLSAKPNTGFSSNGYLSSSRKAFLKDKENLQERKKRGKREKDAIISPRYLSITVLYVESDFPVIFRLQSNCKRTLISLCLLFTLNPETFVPQH